MVLAAATNSAPDTTAAFRKEFGLPFPVIRDGNLAVLTRYRVCPIPTSFLIDRQGVIHCVHMGTWSDALLADELQLSPNASPQLSCGLSASWRGGRKSGQAQGTAA